MIKLSKYTSKHPEFKIPDIVVTGAISEAYERFVKAKESILINIIEQVEKRPATIEDARHFTICQQAGSNKELIVYKGVEMGYIETDFVKLTVTFTPT